MKAKLVSMGLDPAGAMEVSKTRALAGWFNGAPTPGELGPAVIVGHVDWGGKIGVFYKLKTFRNVT